MKETIPDIITATATGDRLTALLSLRDLLAERLEATKSGRDTASISKRLADVLREIDDLRQAQTSERDAMESIRDRFRVAK